MRRRLWICSVAAVVAPMGLAAAATYHVNSISGLTTRIGSAAAGDVIVVSNGVYVTSASISVNRAGNAANPIVIRAETIGGVEIAGTHGFSLNSPAAHVHIQGFRFTHAAGRNAINSGATFCRFTRNIFECAGGGYYLVVAGHDAHIDRNEFRNKSTVGNMIDVRGSGSQVAQRVWIHHNYFRDFSNAGENGAETVRFGLSGLSLSTGFGLVEHNLFVRCVGENEMISNKSSGNTYRYNTVLDSPGAEISQRHGNDCLYYGNYMRNTGGIRVFGDRHKFFSNYLEGNSIGLNMGNGDGDIYDGAALTAHDRPDDNIVVHNTFINNNTHYQMGGRTGGLGSSNTVVANNIFQGGGSIGSISSSAPYTGSWSNNIRWQTSSAGSMPASAYLAVNPMLALDASGAYHIQAGSPAINAGRNVRNYYGFPVDLSFVDLDMDRQPRDANRDIGADEFSTEVAAARILTTNDVGPLSGLAGQVMAPVITPDGGNHPPGPVQVAIASATPGASVRYTTNGGVPGPGSGILYSGPVTLSTNAVLRAIAYKADMADSTVTTASFQIGGPYVFEAEAVPVAGFGAATAPQTDVNNSGGIWIALLADGAGDYVEYTLPEIPAGIYELAMAYKAHPNRGILTLAVNEKVLGTPLDQYADPPAYPEITYGPAVFLTRTNPVMRQTVVGRNSAAGAFTLSADKFTLRWLSPVRASGLHAQYGDGNVILSGSDGVPGTACQLITSNDVAVPVEQWTFITRIVLDSSGAFSLSVPISPQEPERYFRLRLVP